MCSDSPSPCLENYGERVAQEPVNLLLEHRKSTSREGYSSLPWMFFLCVSLALAPTLFMREDLPERFPIGIAILWYGLIALAALATLNFRHSSR
jgi:hypothetical protein